MEALSMLAPSERSVRGKLQLFLRLWVARQKYESLRPYGDTSARRVRFHLEQLQACWDQVVEFQRALGMEVEHFNPTDKFELIYVISAFVDRELNQRENTLIGVQARWSAYQQALRKLSFQMNGYDFTDACIRCQQIIIDLRTPERPTEAEVIPLPPQQLAQLNGIQRTELKMREEQDQSDSGSSRYSPGGRLSYSRK